MSAETPGIPDERPQRRREYSGAGSTLGLAALVILVVGGLVYWFEFRGDDGGARTGGGFGIVPLAESLNPTGRAPAGDIGRAAPAFRLANVFPGGEPVELTDYRGQWVLVNFWASWCPPCRAETPALQAFSEKMAGRGLVVLGVNQQETPETARAFAEEFGVTYPMALDRDGEVSIAYRVGSGLPITMLIRPDGVIERVFRGAIGEDELATVERDVGQ